VTQEHDFGGALSGSWSIADFSQRKRKSTSKFSELKKILTAPKSSRNHQKRSGRNPT
jgi:hypothetical protein